MLFAFSSPAYAAGGRLVIASTTSTQNSGLFDVLIPAYESWTKLKGVKVQVVAVGTGKALENARRGDADLLFVHDAQREKEFVAEGYGDERIEVMYNDFVIVGPKDDPAGVSGARNATDAMRRIFDKGSPFVSRGDESGTHSREKALWRLADRDPSKLGKYMSAGQGMAATVRIADEKGAYTLVDRSTYNKLRWKLKGIRGMFQGDPELYNQYSVIAVSPNKHPHVNHEAALDFIAFVTGRAGQKVIGDYKDEHGGTLFVPNAKKRP